MIATPSDPYGGSFCDASSNAQQCFYNLYVAVDPRNSKIIYLGGADVFRTTDGGTTWTDLGGYTGYIHVDQHAFAFNLTSASSSSTPGIIIGNDGGVWSSIAGNTCAPASCWRSLNNGLGITQFYSVSAHPTNVAAFIGGTQDNGVLNRTSTGWVQIDGGDGGWTG